MNVSPEKRGKVKVTEECRRLRGTAPVMHSTDSMTLETSEGGMGKECKDHMEIDLYKKALSNNYLSNITLGPRNTGK